MVKLKSILRGWFLQHTPYNLAKSAHALGLDDVQAPLLCSKCSDVNLGDLSKFFALNLEDDNDAFDCCSDVNLGDLSKFFALNLEDDNDAFDCDSIFDG